MKRKRKEDPCYWIVRFPDEGKFITGFRYPPLKAEPGTADNKEDGEERRISSHCIAKIGTERLCVWADEHAAAFVAKATGGKVFSLTREELTQLDPNGPGVSVGQWR